MKSLCTRMVVTLGVLVIVLFWISIHRPPFPAKLGRGESWNYSPTSRRRAGD